MGVVDCIWNAVVGNKRSEARLLEVEGQDKLLDLLEVCPVLMRSQITGVLADLSLNKRCIPYLTAWRSDRSMVSAVQLFMRLWEEEEHRLKVERAEGVVNNLWKPLGKHFVGAERPERPTDYFNDFGRQGVDADGDGIDDGLQTTLKGEEMRPTTLAAFKKLEKALAAGAKGAGGNLEMQLKKLLKSEDIRGKIANTCESIGWEESEKVRVALLPPFRFLPSHSHPSSLASPQGLSAHEKMTHVMVKSWLVFTRAQAWLTVRDLLVAENVKVRASDRKETRASESRELGTTRPRFLHCWAGAVQLLLRSCFRRATCSLCPPPPPH